MKRLSQKERILRHLLSGRTLTALGAQELYGCFRLAARIWDLKQEGHLIASRTIRFGDAEIAQYGMEVPGHMMRDWSYNITGTPAEVTRDLFERTAT